MILAARENLISAQCDITAAFVHAHLPKGEKVYVHQPRGFNRGSQYVLSLKRSLYGMRQSPRYFFQYLSKRLEKHGVLPSNLDPCLFCSKNLVVIVYVDDLLIYAREDKDIEDLIKKLQDDDVLLRREGTAEGYLGIKVERDGNKTTFSQPGLIKQIIEALGLNSKYSTSISTPAESVAFPRDIDGQPASGSINYASVIGMLLYSGHTRP